MCGKEIFVVLCMGLAYQVVCDRRLHRRVVNGRTMVRGEWPFHVSMHYLKPFIFTNQTKMQHLCGGALIDRKWVLTAGHCVALSNDMRATENWKMVLGEHNQYIQDKGEQVIAPEEFIVHPDFKPYETSTWLNDIALVKLSEEAKITKYVDVATLNPISQPENTECKTGGWGQVSSEPYGWGMYIPLKATVYITNNATCNEAYSKLKAGIKVVIDNSVICAGLPEDERSSLQTDESDANDACNGDSGSPLMCKSDETGEFEVTGIVSGGEGCGSSKYPGIYTSISYHYDWILDVINNNSSELYQFAEI